MAWFLYNGLTPKPIPTGDGNTVAVRPQHKVEIKQITQEVQRLISSGKLIRTSPLKDDIKRAPAAPLTTVRPSGLMDWVAEKGSTPSRGIPPTRADGKVELTDGEKFAQKVVVAGKSSSAEADAGVPEAPKGKSGKGNWKNRG